MGIAVAGALFPEIFLEYLMFVIPFYIAIYAWGIPNLLIPKTHNKKTFKEKLKTLLNLMFIAMIVGIIIGLLNLTLPSFISTSINSLGSSMSSIAMILTGIIVSKISLKENFTNIKVYLLSFIKLILIPILFVIALSFINISETIKICIICAVAMPLGLNTIVIPTAYDLDTKEASSMALISHLLSAVTLPLIFLLFEYLVLK
jgi:predicted permease